MGMLALAVTGWVLIRKRCSAYGAICLGVTVFMGLFLLDTAVLIRIGDGVAHKTGFDPPPGRVRDYGFGAEYGGGSDLGLGCGEIPGQARNEEGTMLEWSTAGATK